MRLSTTEYMPCGVGSMQQFIVEGFGRFVALVHFVASQTHNDNPSHRICSRGYRNDSDLHVGRAKCGAWRGVALDHTCESR